VAAAVGVFPQRALHAGNLVDHPPIRRRPAAPLAPIDGTQVAVLVGPLVPDAAAALLQPAHVGLAAQEPQQLDQDRAEVHLLGGQQRKAVSQIEAHLPAEHAEGADAGAVAAFDAGRQDFLEQRQILPLGMVGLARWNGRVESLDGHDPSLR